MVIAPPRAWSHVSRAPPEGLDWSSTREGFLRRAIGRPPQAFEPAPNKQGGPASQPEPPTCVGREGLRARPSAKDAPPLRPSAVASSPRDAGPRASRLACHGYHLMRVSVRTYPHWVAPGRMVRGRTPLPPPPYTLTRYPPVGVPVGGGCVRGKSLYTSQKKVSHTASVRYATG